LNENGNVPVPVLRAMRFKRIKRTDMFNQEARMSSNSMPRVSRTARITNNSDTNANSAYSRLG
jgi:hypothetical protein